MSNIVNVNREMLQQVLAALEMADSRDGVYSYIQEIDAVKAALDTSNIVNVNREMLQQVLAALEMADSRDGVYSYIQEIDAVKAALDTSNSVVDNIKND